MLFKGFKKYFLQQEQTVHTPKQAIQNAQIPPIQQRKFVHRFQTYIQDEALFTLFWNVSIMLTFQFNPRLPKHSLLLSS